MQAYSLADSVKLAKLIHCSTMLTCNSRERFTLLHLMITSVSNLFISLTLRTSVTIHISRVISILTICATKTSCQSSFLAISALAIDILIGHHILVTEVEHQSRIKCHTTETCLEMEVRTCTTSSIATQSNRFTSTYVLILCHQLLRHVSIDSLQPICMTDNYIFAISLTLITNDTDLSRKSSANSIADINLHVKSFMLTSPARTKVRRDNAAWRRHAKVTQINAERVG